MVGSCQGCCLSDEDDLQRAVSGLAKYNLPLSSDHQFFYNERYLYPTEVYYSRGFDLCFRCLIEVGMFRL